jgi:hypothetical protein
MVCHDDSWCTGGTDEVVVCNDDDFTLGAAYPGL